MLYNNSRNSSSGRHSGVGAVDPFNQKKLADEAKRDREQQEETRKQQEKNKLQLQIDNLQRQIVKSEIDLRTKDTQLNQTKLKLADAKRAVFLLEGEIKKQEGSVNYENQEALMQDHKDRNTGKVLDNNNAELKKAEREMVELEREYNKDKASLDALLPRISQMNDELAILNAQARSLKGEVDRDQVQITTAKTRVERLVQGLRNTVNASKQILFEKSKIKKNLKGDQDKIKKEKQEIFNKKRVLEQLENDDRTISQEVLRMKRDKEAKEREINDLKRKKDSIR